MNTTSNRLAREASHAERLTKRFVEDLIDSAASHSSEAREHASHGLQRSAETLARKTRRAARSSGRTLRRQSEDLVDFAHDRPGLTAGVAALTGALLGGTLLYAATRLIKRANERHEAQFRLPAADDEILEIEEVESHVSDPVDLEEEYEERPVSQRSIMPSERR